MSSLCSQRPLRTLVRAVVVLTLLFGWSAVTGSVAAHAGERAGQQAAVAVRGGDTLYGAGGTRCTVGFNARFGSTFYALVSGRCAQGAQTWYADSALTVQVGVTAGVSFPGDDYASIRYTNTDVAYPGEVSLGGGGTHDITRAANPVVGQVICHVGRTSGYHCGILQAVNVTVNYGGGTVYGLFRSTICSEPGDTGGPAFSGGTAVGIIVGGSGNCSSGGVTYYQPVAEGLSAYGLSVY
ncbi:S1 family peptidase [Streptomyces albus]|uniref:S1 family peptidase n=1 Tax=Streptomyces albus TaxID=1888 RepID=UPI0004C79D1A|nr:S1 family peptidase [Streptomyces albus]